jgi:hypothetical protein
VKKLAFAFSLCAVSMFAEDLSGMIGDSKCGAKHVAAGEKDVACAQKCVKGGASPVLLSGDKVYKIDNPDAVMDHVGHQVTVTGKVDGDTVHVDSVKMKS